MQIVIKKNRESPSNNSIKKHARYRYDDYFHSMREVIIGSLCGRKNHHIMECWKFKAYGRRKGAINSKPQKENPNLGVKK